jgi:hypothetical protein
MTGNGIENLLHRVIINTGDDLGSFINEWSICCSRPEFRESSFTFSQLLEQLLNNRDNVNNSLRIMVRDWLIPLDGVSSRKWTEGTVANTDERRSLIYKLLGLSASDIEILNLLVPPATGRAIVIRDDENRSSWWLGRKETEAHDLFYWKNLSDYLREKRGFSAENLRQVDSATDQILDMLSDPKSVGVSSTKGLVVGYVQSGKTTNINALIAKSIDSGYRLIIVLSGLTDLLRNQTQRRVDMEVVGKENLISDNGNEIDLISYQNELDWNDLFIDHNSDPKSIDKPAINRLTTKSQDFMSARGARVFTKEWVDASKQDVYLAVLKKNKAPINKLVKQLNRLDLEDLAEIRAIIIDDESDQASINTLRPKLLSKTLDGDRERTKVHAAIVDLVSVLPRAQYLGITATPFANCFIDPNDAKGLFPKDFVVALEQPEGYMGVKHFFDIDEESFDLVDCEDISLSNKAKHVRDISVDIDNEDEVLRSALDAFLLSGALKLYRREKGLGAFRHHTFLYHNSVSRDNHKNARDKLVRLWDGGKYDSVEGRRRLEAIYKNDFLTFSDSGSDRRMFPESFKELASFIARAEDLIGSGEKSVLVINSDKDSETPDFEITPIWKMVVGGSKLSRGYTIEGLTISYFRRTSNNESSIMQLGRWFGYRPNYRDLVRLYISRSEKIRGGKNPVFLDLYNAFYATCKDEELFRRELVKYLEPDSDGKRLKPIQIPPLVTNSHPLLKPAARNMMWNAHLISENYGGKTKTFTYVAVDPQALKRNLEVISNLISSAKESELFTLGTSSNNFEAYLFEFEKEEIGDFLEDYMWSCGAYPSFELLKKFVKLEGNNIDSWKMVFPQLRQKDTSKFEKLVIPVKGSLMSFDTVERARSGDENIMNQIDDKEHRKVCQVICGQVDGSAFNPSTRKLIDPNSAVILAYAARSPKQGFGLDTPAIAFTIILPNNNLPNRPKWGVVVDSGDVLVPVDLQS